MKQPEDRNLQLDAQEIMNSIRRIVKSLREASKIAEKLAGLSSAQLFVLQKIAESDHSLRVNHLAAKTLTHQSSVSVVITKLVEKGLVERTSSKEDARAVELSLSKKGAKLIQSGFPLIQQQLMDGISLLSSSERQGLVLGLRALIEKAGLQDLAPDLFFEDSLREKIT